MAPPAILACVQTTAPRTQELAGDVTQLAEGVCAFMMHVQKSSGEDFFRQVGELEISLSQLKLLMLLDRDGEHTLKEIAESLVLSLPAASRAVDGLHRRGMVERREDSEDRRHKRVTITAKGSEVIERLNQARFAGVQQFIETLTTNEREKLARALAPVLERAEITARRPHGDAA
jgi:DNA-binding MarR family transcriptional regulator